MSRQDIEAALVVPIPEVDPLVGPFRIIHDPSAAKGMPAHITINYPFLPWINRGESVHRELKELFANTESFQFTLRQIARFPDVLYLAPEPDIPFRRLIDLVAAYFPESPPYEGAFEQIIPHLTIAQTEVEEVLTSVERELIQRSQEFLPLTVQARQVWLMDNRTGMWQQRGSYPLGAAEEGLQG